MQCAVEPRACADPVAAHRQLVVGADARAALQPLDIGDQTGDIGELVAVEADEGALGADVELGYASRPRVRLDLHELDEVRGFGRQRAEAVDHLRRETVEPGTVLGLVEATIERHA